MMVKFIKKIDDILIKIQSIIISFLVFAMIILVVLQVVCRYFLHISTPWAEEFARLAMVWAIFIAASLGVRKVEHPRVDILLNKMNDKLKLLTEFIIYIFVIALAFIMVKYGLRLVETTAKDITTSLQYPRNVFYWPVPVSGILIALYSIERMVKSILSLKEKKSAV
jgi:TRAP-type C4-dicarboxylate transport system permease small subunit